MSAKLQSKCQKYRKVNKQRVYVLNCRFNMTNLGMCIPIYYALCLSWIVVGACIQEAVTGNSAAE